MSRASEAAFRLGWPMVGTRVVRSPDTNGVIPAGTLGTVETRAEQGFTVRWEDRGLYTYGASQVGLILPFDGRPA